MGTSLNSRQTSQIWNPHPKVYSVQKPIAIMPSLYFVDPKETECLALNIYFEAAVESTAGKLAVAHVTLNRVESNRYPNTVCEVVKEGRHYTASDGQRLPIRDRCQFSWYCDGKYDVPSLGRGWSESRQVAQYALTQTDLLDITDGATHYHADYIANPRWASERDKTVKIDTHIFYNKRRTHKRVL